MSTYSELSTAKRSRNASGSSLNSKAQEQLSHSNDNQAMEVDEDSATRQASPLDVILSKNDTTMVAEMGALPAEVIVALKGTDLFVNPYEARIDYDTGYGLVVSKEFCYVWLVQKDIYKPAPLCIKFPMPQVENPTTEQSQYLPLVVITEPDQFDAGLLACSADGTCWFWDRIERSIANLQDYAEAKLPLSALDFAVKIENAEPAGYFVGTNESNLFRISINRSKSRLKLDVVALGQPRIGALSTILSFAGYAQPSNKVVALTSGTKLKDASGKRELFIMTRKSLLKWSVTKSGECRMVSDTQLLDSFSMRINQDFRLGLGGEFSEKRLRLLDVEYAKFGKVVVLVSFFRDSFQTAETPLTYGLFTLSSHDGIQYGIDQAKYLDYEAEEDIRPTASPRLLLPRGGPGAFIITPNAVIVSSTIDKLVFEDVIAIQKDTIIGYGVDHTNWWTQDIENESVLSIVCRDAGHLGIEVNFAHIKDASAKDKASNLDEEALATKTLRDKLEQAVFFGNKKRNPLSFDLSRYRDGDLTSAALDLCQEIMDYIPKRVPRGRDLTEQQQERYQRAKDIIEVIQDSRMVNRLDIGARFQLCWNAEKLLAASSLVKATNRSKDEQGHIFNGERFSALLHDAARATTKDEGAAKKDYTRLFFTYHVSDISDLLTALGRVQKGDEETETIYEANRIFIISLQSATNYRRSHLEKYQLRQSPQLEPWTATECLIETLSKQFDLTLTEAKKEPTLDRTSKDMKERSERKLHDANVKKALLNQACDLADLVLQAYSERLAYFDGLSRTGVQEIEFVTLKETYRVSRSKLLTPLMDVLEQHDRIFELAEKYRDYETLVKLCAEEADSDERLDIYLNEFGQGFADVLFEWYISMNKSATLLKVGESFSELLTSFLDRHPQHVELGWLHDVRNGEYLKGSLKLQEAHKHEPSLDRRKTLLSLTKLLFMLEPQAPVTAPVEISNEDLQHFAHVQNAELGLVTIQSMLSSQFLEMSKLYTSKDDKVKAVLETFTARYFKQQPGLRRMVGESVAKLMDREWVGSEDLVDVLMAKGPGSLTEALNVFGVALDISMQAEDIPEDRRPHVMQDVWRRVFIQDEPWSVPVLGSESKKGLLTRIMDGSMCRAYAVIYEAQGSKTDMMLDPENASSTISGESFQNRFSPETPPGELSATAKMIYKDIELEDEKLNLLLNQGNLLDRWAEVKQIVASPVYADHVRVQHGVENMDMDEDL